MLENLPAVQAGVPDSPDPAVHQIMHDQAARRYRLLFEMNVDGILLATTEGRVLDANFAACRLLQIPIDQLSASTGTISDLNEGTITYVAGVLRRAGRFRGRLPLTRTDRRTISVDAYCTAYRAEDGTEQVCIAFHEVAAQVESADPLFQLAPVLASSNDAIIAMTLEGVILTWNSGAEQLYGLPASNMKGKHLNEVVPPELHGELQAAFRKIVQGKYARSVEMDYLRNDGLHMHLSLALSPVNDAVGRVVGVSGIAHDITELKRMQETLRELATRDELTRLYNRREMSRILTDEIARCRRYNREMSLLMIDIDRFKQVNDTWGHQAGDEILQGIARLLVENTRATDHVARYGGEEMVVILPETSAEQGIIAAEHLRLRVAGHEFEVGTSPDSGGGAKLNVTISIGLASFSGEFNTEEALLVAADRALYAAKRRGRNCAVPFSRSMLNTKELDEARAARPGGD
ncbi:MAG: diguanylate cyclase [Chloroflexota bacterium]|nr:diguanylate cyclase [Chloroflexota bacterium]